VGHVPLSINTHIPYNATNATTKTSNMLSTIITISKIFLGDPRHTTVETRTSALKQVTNILKIPLAGNPCQEKI
jgi:hypothetical protein